MLTTRDEQTRRARDILAKLQSENIVTDNATLAKMRFDVIRRVTMQCADKAAMIEPALTAYVATTLLQAGLCQEHAHRFVLEYCLQYKEQDVSIVFTSNPVIGRQISDHAFVVIGQVNAAEIGSQTLSDFLRVNNESVIVDPLFPCAGNSDGGIEPLTSFCENNHITHVIGIKSYHQTPEFVHRAATIKENANKVAQQTKLAMSNMSHTKASNVSFRVFNIIDALISKYALPDKSQASFEAALRIAVDNNEIEDVRVLAKIVNNLDAQDTNPESKQTVLHLAAIKGHHECYQILLADGAKPELLDAQNKTADHYMKEYLVNAAQLPLHLQPK